MSTQQDIYAAGSENRSPMLNKDNYVPWSSRLLRYAKSKPNGKLIYNSIMNGPYARRMIPEPGDPDREVPVAETFYEQTNDELTEKEVKQMEADDQAIPIILMGLYEFGSRQTDVDGWSIECRESICLECSLESGCSECWMEIIWAVFFCGLANQNLNDNRNEDWVILLGTAQSDQEKGMLPFFRLRDLEDIEEMDQLRYNNHNHLKSIRKSMTNLKGVIKTVSSLQEEKKRLKTDFKICEDELLDKQIQLENKIKELDNMLVKTGQSIQTMHMLSPMNRMFYQTEHKMALDTSNLQTKLERTKEKFEDCMIKKENEYAKLWNDWYKKCEECKYDKISYDKAYNDMQQKIERLQAQLGDLKGKCKDTPCVSDTLDPLPQTLK
ncbi:hypothetical protein Tco_0588637 [Tanacetum coccineum]